MMRIRLKKTKYCVAIFLIFLSILGLTLNSSLVALKTSNSIHVNMSTNGYPEVDLSFIPDINYDSLN
ncbi:MAG: hypothetical protein ACW972_04255, partial [Promethearchaeota archaeon]